MTDTAIDPRPSIESEEPPFVIFLDDIDDDGPDPSPEPPTPQFKVVINEPAHHAEFKAPASAGVTITASGYLWLELFTASSLEIRWGGTGPFVPVAIAANATWQATSPKLMTPGKLEVSVRLRGTRFGSTVLESTTSKRTVTVTLTDNVPPKVEFILPTALKEILPDSSGDYFVPLKVRVTDNTAVNTVEWSRDGLTWFKVLAHVGPEWSVTAEVTYVDALQPIFARATDTAGNTSAPVMRLVRTLDKKAPKVKINTPKDANISLLAGATGGGVLPLLKGTANDTQSKVNRVEWSLNGGPFQLAAKSNGISWSAWQITNVAIPGPLGPKNITVRAFDNAGNQSQVVRLDIALTEAYRPKDPTVQEYFSNVLDFIVRRFRTSANLPVTQLALIAALQQPFDKLLALDAVQARQQESQLRLVLETLRRFFDQKAAAGVGAPAATGLRQQAEATYRQAMYEVVLRRLGTSLDELRAAAHAGQATRRALANRLGFELMALKSIGAGGPSDTLALFLLPAGTVTDAALEKLFGVNDFARDPFAPVSVDPTLLDLQLRYLDASWLAQDGSSGGVVIDPDVIDTVDLKPGANPAADVLAARRKWAESLIALLRDPTDHKTSTVDQFDEVASRVRVSTRDLLDLSTAYESGEDIEPELAARGISLAAFFRLLVLRTLAVANVMTETDWDEFESILLQIEKLRIYPDWREDERAARIALGPDHFVIGPVERSGPAPSPWRVIPGARQRWRTTLEGRIEQRQALRQALASMVAAAEEDALPGLRDGLVTAFGPMLPGVTDLASALNNALLIDVEVTGFPRISRVEHALGTLQALLLALRTGQPFGWRLDTGAEDQVMFDEELRWIGAYETWRAAMRVFLYPENVLVPTLRPVPETTQNFRNLIDSVRALDRLTPQEAATLATGYHSSLVLVHTPQQLAKLKADIETTINNATGPGSNTQKLRKISAGLRERYLFVPLVLAMALQRSGQYLAALDWFRMVYAFDLQPAARKIYFGLTLERDPDPDDVLFYERNVFWLADPLNPHDIVDESYDDAKVTRYDVLTRYTVMAITRCLLEFADAEFAQDTAESLPRARGLYARAAELMAIPELNPTAVSELSPNDVVIQLKLRATAGLDKLRAGRNFAGLRRQVETVPALTSTATGQLVVPGSGPFGSGAVRAFQPSPYRYAALIDRARQLATLAGQVEQAYLGVLERRDNEAYNLLKAHQDLFVAEANVRLAELRVDEAVEGELLAQTQQARADYQVLAYQDLLDTSMNKWESQLLKDYREVREAKTLHAYLDAALAAAQAMNSAASGGFLGTGVGAALGTAAAAAALAMLRGSHTVEMIKMEENIQRHSIHASVENRRRDWALQQGVAQKDSAIAAQQNVVAGAHTKVARQEVEVAEVQLTNAKATIDFLGRKFTNVDLYEWMIGVLADIYRWFLRQAATVAATAQSQLAFERQETIPPIVQRDYWESLTTESALSGQIGPDRRGLTGSFRLLRDIEQLDQYSMDTNRRKLQLTKTFSLARLAPLEFQRFRDTGVLTFATPMALFDQEFPGHYLRLIKRVRTSVVALVPPNHGIRATLSTGGVSRVVVGGGDSFQTVPLRRDPESVALTSPNNATGMFELDAQPELLMPFEYMGVDALWALEMPKPANPFDYRTIADVLVTFEYTALADESYRRKVVSQLDGTALATRAVSLRDQFPDQWYDLHNPDQLDRPFRVELPMTATDFPVNLADVWTANLGLYVVFAEPASRQSVQATLRFAPAGSTADPVGGSAASTTDGVISTRLGNAPSWLPMLNQAPYGTWTLSFADSPEIRRLFTEGALDDLVLAVSYSARTPQWPA